MNDSESELLWDKDSPTSLAETLAQKPANFSVNDPEEIDALTMPTMLPQILPTTLRAADAPKRNRKTAPRVTVAAPDSTLDEALPKMNASKRAPGLSLQGGNDSTVTLSQTRSRKPNYSANSSQSLFVKKPETARRTLPTASFGGEKVLLPTATVLTVAMEKASSRAPPQKANIQESVHMILAKLSTKEGGGAGNTAQRQREANFLSKEMDNVLAARRSQKEMLEFQSVLEHMEEEVALRRRANRRAMDGVGSTAADDGYALSPHFDSSDEEENEDDELITTVKEEKERLRSMQTSTAIVQRINEREARRWLETQKKVIENPSRMKMLQEELQESSARLRAARTSRKNDGPTPKRLLLENGNHGQRPPHGAQGGLAEQDISWISLASELSKPQPLSPEDLSLHERHPGSLQFPTNSVSTVHTTAEEPQTPPPQAVHTEAQLLLWLQRGNGRSIYGIEKRSMSQKERTEKENLKRQQRLQKQQFISRAKESGESDAENLLSGRKREVHFAPSLTKSPDSSLAKAPPPPPAEPEAKPEKKLQGFQVGKKRIEPLPAAAGVGNRSAALIRHNILSLRRRSIAVEMESGEDVSRTCKCIEQLFPLRVALLEKDLLEAYDVTHPSEWDAKYRTKALHGPSALRSTPASSLRDPAEEEAGDHAEKSTRSHTRTETPPSNLTTSTTRKANINDEKTMAHEHRKISSGSESKKRRNEKKSFVDPGVMLEKHRRVLFNTALRMDDEERKKACLAYVDCLEALSEDKISTATWPSAAAAFEQSRHYLHEEPHKQNYAGFTTLVHENFPVEQLVQWPVQEMLRRLASIFFVSSNQYRDWMAGLYQKMSNTHDYEGRFRAVDCTIKNKKIPTEAHVRITLHRCRKLPRADTVVAVPKLKLKSGPKATKTEPSGEVSQGTTEVDAAISSQTASPANFDAPTTPVRPEHAMPSDGAPRFSVGEGSQELRPGVEGPEEDQENERVVHIPEYAVRLSAERQEMTSSAVPAGNHPSGSAGEEGHGAATKEESGNSVTARQRVYFYDQTFKLHLYDIASVISVDLLSDGVQVSSGSFSIERYLHWKRSSIWLPLTGKYSRRTELQLTIEVL